MIKLGKFDVFLVREFPVWKKRVFFNAGDFVFLLFDRLGLYKWADEKNKSREPWQVTYFWYFPLPKFLLKYWNRDFAESCREVGIYGIRPDDLLKICRLGSDLKPFLWRDKGEIKRSK